MHDLSLHAIYLQAQVDDSSLYTRFLNVTMHDLSLYAINLKAEVNDSSLYTRLLNAPMHDLSLYAIDLTAQVNDSSLYTRLQKDSLPESSFTEGFFTKTLPQKDSRIQEKLPESYFRPPSKIGCFHVYSIT